MKLLISSLALAACGGVSAMRTAPPPVPCDHQSHPAGSSCCSSQPVQAAPATVALAPLQASSGACQPAQAAPAAAVCQAAPAAPPAVAAPLAPPAAVAAPVPSRVSLPATQQAQYQREIEQARRELERALAQAERDRAQLEREMVRVQQEVEIGRAHI